VIGRGIDEEKLYVYDKLGSASKSRMVGNTSPFKRREFSVTGGCYQPRREADCFSVGKKGGVLGIGGLKKTGRRSTIRGEKNEGRNAKGVARCS